MENEALIFKYFEGTLTDKEKLVFDLLLEEDPEFREQLTFEEDVKQVIREKERKVLKKKLQGFETSAPQAAAPRKPFWRPLQIAASLALLFAIGWYFYSVGSADKMEVLYTANYEKYPNTVYSMTRGQGEDTSLERLAFEAYETNETKSALRNFQELKAKGQIPYADFYLAQVYLANGDTPEALESFKEVIGSNGNFKRESLWYAALCYVKLERPKEAIPLLESLIMDGSYRKDKAKVLLDQLQ
ncbi:tetratricopeptide repeat protein [Muriicola sp.]|uniref:tetratricopeptide repeat protein n=1 Tax=Muriicola sp. TaxID=2020856 RepID=UPI003C7102AC